MLSEFTTDLNLVSQTTAGGVTRYISVIVVQMHTSLETTLNPTPSHYCHSTFCYSAGEETDLWTVAT